MTRKEKNLNLLLKDLCARLPYGVICADIHADEKFTNKWDIFAIDRTFGNEFLQVCISNCGETYGYKIPIERIKPYLFPLSSMTEKQNEEYCSLQQKVIYNSKGLINSDVIEYVNWCYKNHIDINNLIPIGLAIDATRLNIY